jgi:hypothetical protein
MSTIKMKNGTEIWCEDWGTGRPFLFSHADCLSELRDDNVQLNRFLRTAHEV